MQAPSHGYQPDRLTSLDTNVVSAATSLAGITSTDPAAAEAIAAVRTLHATLTDAWVPAIRAVRTSTALSGGVVLSGLGGDRSVGWKKSEDGPEPGTLTFQPFVALSGLFPGDGDITAAEIAAKITEILDADPSEQQVLDLAILMTALEEIAMNTQLSADVIDALGPDGVTAVYARLHDLGYPYPVLSTPDHPRLEPDLPGVVEAFGRVVTQGVKRPGAALVIEEVIEMAGEYPTLRYVAPLAGLARADHLPPDLADQLLDALRELDERDLSSDTMRPTNVAFPGLPLKTESLVAILFGGNPDLVTRHVFARGGFVDGGEEVFADLIETDARNDVIGAEVSEALGNVIQQIIDQTPYDELVVIDEHRNQTAEGVVFDIVALLLDNDFKVSGLGALVAIAPFLPVLTGSLPNSETPFSRQQIGELYVDLFNDMSTEEVESALAAILSGALARFDEFDPGEFESGQRPDIEFGLLLDGVLGPATVAIEQVVDDREERETAWRNAVRQAFGLLGLPGGRVAGFVIQKGFKQFVERTILTDRGPLDAADEIDAIAVEAALMTIYGTDKFHDRIVENALDDWDLTAAGLRSGLTHPTDTPADHAARERRIDEIERLLDASLVPGADPVDLEIFLDLPEVRDIVVELFTTVTLSANGQRSR